MHPPRSPTQKKTTHTHTKKNTHKKTHTQQPPPPQKKKKKKKKKNNNKLNKDSHRQTPRQLGSAVAQW